MLRQAVSGRPVIFDHAFVGKFHPGLHHNGNHTLPCRLQMIGAERRPERGQRGFAVLRRGYGYAVLIFLGAAWDGHLTADDIDRRRGFRVPRTVLGKSFLGDTAELGAAVGDHNIR